MSMAPVWRFRGPHYSSREFSMRTSEPKPHQVNNLLVSFRFRSSQVKAPRKDATFGIGTLVKSGVRGAA
jgi:hypothetical protein